EIFKETEKACWEEQLAQRADKDKARILPWVDNVFSRTIFFFHYNSCVIIHVFALLNKSTGSRVKKTPSYVAPEPEALLPHDETLKQSFLTAILMLVGAVSCNEGAQSYELSQVSELFECLMLLMEKEPQDMLCTSTHQQAIHIISSFCTSLEALKSLLPATGHWQDFAHLELQGAWDLFATTHTDPQGMGLLASRCKQVTALITQLLPSLQSQEQRGRKAAIVILTGTCFLYSPALLEVLPKQAALTMLAQSLRDPSPEVLGNVLFFPEKGRLLRGLLPPFLDGFSHSGEPGVVRIMGTVSDMLHRLGAHSTKAQSFGITINARFFSDDERDGVQAAAMALFGELVASMTGRKLSGLRTQVHQSMVALLLHLKDSCRAVVTMTHSQEGLSIHLAQALGYLHSRRRHIKTWAALFMAFEDLKNDPEPSIQELATRQSFLQQMAAGPR
ncbi:hypothetical protein EI555_014792, partial [Monodon monoceros]